VCGDQSGRAAAPIIPHLVQTIRGHNDRPGSHRAASLRSWSRCDDAIRRRNRPANPGTRGREYGPASNGAGFLDRLSVGHFSRPFEPSGLFDRLIVRVLEGDMSERRITQLFGLILGGLFTFGLVLNAFAF
jgi:hypothetical protein